MSTFITHHYPENILSAIHKNRCMTIIVKTGTIASSIDTLKAGMDKTATAVNSILDQYKNSGTIAGNGRKISDINSTNIEKNVKNITKAETIYALCLPLPNELMDAQSHRWDIEKGFISNMLGPSIEGNQIYKVLGEASMTFGFRKPLVDPGQYQNYSGSAPRSFNFTFDLIPNNSKEADMIMNIILNLKKFSLPTTMPGGVSLLAPFLFEISIGNEKLKKLINMNDVVLTEISVNYGADGNMQLFSNGVPKYIRLNLAFAERTVVTSEFYD